MKTIKALTNKFECQSISHLIRKYIRSYDIGQRMKYLQRGPIGYIIPLHMPVKLLCNISMDFLDLSTVLTECSVLNMNISIGEDHVVSVLRLCTIINRQSRLKFLISVLNNFCAKQCTTTFDSYVVHTIGYPHCIRFDQDTLFILSCFQS